MFSISDDDDLDYLSGDFLDVLSPKNRPAKRSSFDLGLNDHNANTKKPCTTEQSLVSRHGKYDGQKENSEGKEELDEGFTLRPAPFLRSITTTTPRLPTTNSFTSLADTSNVSKPNAHKLCVSSTVANKPGGCNINNSDQFNEHDSESQSTTNDLDFGLDSDSDLELSLVNAMVGAVEAVSKKVQDRSPAGGFASEYSKQSLDQPSITKYSLNSGNFNLLPLAKQSRERAELSVNSLNSASGTSKSPLHGESEKTSDVNLQPKSVVNSNLRAPLLSKCASSTPRNEIIHNSQVPSTSKINLSTVSNKGQYSDQPPSLSSNNVRAISNQQSIVVGLRTPQNSVLSSSSSINLMFSGNDTANSRNTATLRNNESDGQGNPSKLLRTPNVQQNTPVGSSRSAGSSLRTPNVPVRPNPERQLQTPNLQHAASDVVRSSTSTANSFLRTPNVPLRQNTAIPVTSTPSRVASNVPKQRTPSHQNPLFIQTKVSPPQTTSPCPMEGRPEATTRYITPKCPVPGRMRATGDDTPRSRKKRRKFPGPAGMLPKLAPGQDLDSVSSNPFDNVAKIKEDSGQKTTPEDDPPASQMTQLPLGDEVWLCMKEDIGPEIYQFCRDFNIANIIVKSSSKQLPRGKVPVLCAIVDSVNVLAAEASVILKDTSGEIKATVHRQVVKEFQSELQAGCGLVLKQVGVFSPSVRKHYLNITPNNVVYIYTKKDAQLSCRNVSTITVGEIEGSLLLDQEAERCRSTTPGMPQTSVQSHSTGPNHMRMPVAVTPHTPSGSGQYQNRNSVRTPVTPNSGLNTPVAGRGSASVQSPPCPGGMQSKTPGQGRGQSDNSRTTLASNPGLNTPTGVRSGSGQFPNSSQSTGIVKASGGHLKQNFSGTPQPSSSHANATPTGTGLRGASAGTSPGFRADLHQGSHQPSNVSALNRSQGVGPRTPNQVANQRLTNPGHMLQGPVHLNSGSLNPNYTQGNRTNQTSMAQTSMAQSTLNNAEKNISNQPMKHSEPNHSAGGKFTFKKTSTPSAQVTPGNIAQAVMSTSGVRTSATDQKSIGGKSSAADWENECIGDLLCGLEDEMMDELEV